MWEWEGENIIMNPKRPIRIITLLFIIGLLVFGLTSCKLPASKGPSIVSETNAGFPVPGETEPTSGIDVSAFATQTAQAMPPVAVTPQATDIVPIPPSPTPYPIATEIPPAPTATPTSVTYVQPTQGSLPTSYTLLVGEYPFCIARRFDVNVSELLSLNNLSADTFFYGGEVLQIPQTGNPFEGTRVLQEHPTTYIVMEGDTLGSIACSFGDVSPELIAEQNHLSSYDVSPGTQLVIP